VRFTSYFTVQNGIKDSLTYLKYNNSIKLVTIKDTKKIRLKQEPKTQKSDCARPKKSRVTRRKKRVNGYNADLKLQQKPTFYGKRQ
jgi:hypothetical protein